MAGGHERGKANAWGRQDVHRLSRACAALEQENQALRRQVEQMRVHSALAYRDALTGLYNRRYFDERVRQEWKRAQRQPGYGFSILFIDVNQFKQVNDRHGHAAGDQTLQWVAAYLNDKLRAEDICCRLAGDEFIVILPGAAQGPCQKLIHRLRRKLQVRHRGSDIPIFLSVGQASYPTNATTLCDLIDHADRDMYRDKRHQRPPTLLRRLVPRGHKPPEPLNPPVSPFAGEWPVPVPSP